MTLFCNKEKQLINKGTTSIDNRFIFNYLPEAPDKTVAVYLLGLALSESNGSDNSCETIAQKLNISCEDVMSAYLYWEELGLVHIVYDEPPYVEYYTIRESASALKKISANKYAKFSKEMQVALQGRTIMPNEFNEYYMFLESTTFEPAALVAVAKYCVELKGVDIGWRYILTVARNLFAKGATTLAVVNENLNSQQKYDDDLRLIFKALKTKRTIDYADRENYEKWTKELGFTLDVVLEVAKKCTTGGMTKLNNLLCDYYSHGALSVKEIEDYEQQKTHLYELAKTINRTIGVYYQSLDMIVSQYLVDWLRKGYDENTLVAIAKYCFTSGIRTLNGLADIIAKLYKKGITTLAALNQYLDETTQRDTIIANVLKKAGLDRKVTNNDRTVFRTWTTEWNMPVDLIEYVAELSVGTHSPIAYVNRILSDYKQQQIYTIQQAKAVKTYKYGDSSATTAYIGGVDIERRPYTEEQLNALFTSLDEVDD